MKRQANLIGEKTKGARFGQMKISLKTEIKKEESIDHTKYVHACVCLCVKLIIIVTL